MERAKLNLIGLVFVTHRRATHLIRAFSGSGHVNEQTLCGKGSASESTTIRGYVDGGEFDTAGNPMPICGDCAALL
jgi:hypothetical protein